MFLHSAVRSLKHYIRHLKKRAKMLSGEYRKSYAEITIETLPGNRTFSADNCSRKLILSLMLSIVGSGANVKTRKIETTLNCIISLKCFLEQPYGEAHKMNLYFFDSIVLSIFGYCPTTLFTLHIIPYAILRSDKTGVECIIQYST